ncbi:rod shape-determining protein MreD, partial [Ellagibacter isourolithinifaciens]
FDLLGTGPVGAMAFLLTGVSFLAKRIFMLVNNDTLFMPLLLAAISTLVIELLYAAFMMAFGAGVSALDAFVFRALPGTVYNFLAALIFYPIVVRFLAQPIQQQPGTPHLR